MTKRRPTVLYIITTILSLVIAINGFCTRHKGIPQKAFNRSSKPPSPTLPPPTSLIPRLESVQSSPSGANDTLDDFHSIPQYPLPLTLRCWNSPTSSIDEEIWTELDQATPSPFGFFHREISNGSNLLQAFQKVSKRIQDRAGDYENKFRFLSDFRSYSKREMLKNYHLRAPTLDDLNQVPPKWSKIAWVTTPFRVGVFVSAFFAFPHLCAILNALVEVSADEFDIINEQFTPGIGILYGTFVALTLDILYERQGKVQENASVEAALLSQVTQNMISLFRNEINMAREATQIIADQIRILVYRSRGSEMLMIMRSDPYSRLLSLIDDYQSGANSFTSHEEALIEGLRSEIPTLMEARAKRLSDEASALPPTHFLVLQLLTSLSLIGFTAAAVSITCDHGQPPLESSMVFAGLTAVYVLFYNFCNDMNDPFDGVYQIKRSAAATYLLQTKWIITNQPYGSSIKFDIGELEATFDGYESLAETLSLAGVVDSMRDRINEGARTTLFSHRTAEPVSKELMDEPETSCNHDCPPVPENLTNNSCITVEELLNETATEYRDQSDVSIRQKLVENFQSSRVFCDEESINGVDEAILDISIPTNPAAHTKLSKISSSYFRRVGGFE